MNPMNNRAAVDDIIAFIKAHDEFSLISHISPDGDTLSSSIALYMLITSMGKKAEVICSNPVPKIYRFLPLWERVKLPEQAIGYSAVISVDCADVQRFGRAVSFFNSAGSTATIDHHITNRGFSDINYISPDSSATAEIIYELYAALDKPVTKAVAICIYTGIVTDTGNLSYSNTTPESVRIVARLLEDGLNITELNRLIYRTVPFCKARLQGYVISNMRLERNGEIGLAVLTRAQMLEHNATNEDCEGIVDSVRDVDSVRIAAFIRESSDGSFKVSLRSKDVGDVGRIANNFGGGGHAAAAGYTSYAPLSSVITNFIDAANAILDEQSNR